MGPIICVCTGNICRSPMAERLLAEALKKEGEPLASMKVISAGVAAYDGSPASPNSVEVLREIGVELGDHKSQMLTREMIQESSLILAMTEMHIVAIQEEHGDIANGKLFLFRQWMKKSRQVSDPYGSDEETYRASRDTIAEAVPSVVGYIRETFGK